jgi:hypothetical protein
MNYLTDFIEREKNKSIDTENRLNRLNPDFSEKKLQTPDNESRLNRLNPEREYSEPAQIAELSGVTFEEPGLFHFRGFIVPTRGTMPAYRAHFDENFNL